ncbi:hypothetical protein MN116_007257 [Schistosoma mekongi]|uniref:Uncharacterized protein n=1 Tax=Schistosoma mekongi TaxID=38744 RepID=A0AAE2D3F6_SCHME|nr:hypothetical protein MN116_007257 [Schistosoma mekongi]
MMNNHQLHLKSCTANANCSHSISVLDCVTHIERTINRERCLNGFDFLSGLVYLTPRIQPNISDTDELSFKRPRPSTSYQSIKLNKFHMTLRSHVSSEPNGSNSQESLQFSSFEVLSLHNNEKIPKCVITPIDKSLLCADTIKLEFHQHAYKSTPNSIDDDNNGDDIDSFHTALSKPMNKELESVYKVHCRKLLVAYQEAIQPVTSMGISNYLEAKLLSLFK